MPPYIKLRIGKNVHDVKVASDTALERMGWEERQQYFGNQTELVFRWESGGASM